MEHLKEKLDELYKKKLLNRQPHPKLPLYIYNYRPVVQFDGKWNEFTKMARGLILDKDGNIVARPFEKFFNLGEKFVPEISFENNKCWLFDKVDGSLFIITNWNGHLITATRGSFISDQADKGREILTNHLNKTNDIKQIASIFEEGYTYCFELIYPENKKESKLVVDYGNIEELFFLTKIDNKTGKDVELPFKKNWNSFPCSKYLGIEINNYTNLYEYKDLNLKNKEGAVVYFESGDRLKIKFDEYKRRQKIFFRLSNKFIWEHLKNNEDTTELYEDIPNEFYPKITKTINNFKQQYNKLEDKLKSVHVKIEKRNFQTRKDLAGFIFRNYSDISNLVFPYLDDKDYKSLIWKRLKPKSIETIFD